jgi:hypothetical protein
MTVSVYVEDVTDWACEVFQKMDYTYHWLLWEHLDDTFTGSYTDEGTFQFGSISDTVNLMFWIDRTQAGEGRLDIAIETHVTNTFDFMDSLQYKSTTPPVPSGPDMGLVAAGVGVTAIAIVVVVVVILKKKPQLLGR